MPILPPATQCSQSSATKREGNAAAIGTHVFNHFSLPDSPVFVFGTIVF